MRRLPSRHLQAAERRRVLWHVLAACLTTSCGIDQEASLGTVAQRLPPAGAGSSGAGGAAMAGRTPGGEAGSTAAPPPPVSDAGPIGDPPEPFEPLDAGRPPPEPPPAGPCAAPLRYVGDFACTLSMPFPGPPGSGMPSPTMTTQIAFALEPAGNGTAAEIVEGDFTFVAWNVAFMGRLEGGLDCATGRFEASIVDGMTGAVFGMPAGFVGELHGMLVDAAGTLDGTWMHGPAQDPAGGCAGPWFATPR